jgi:hypothetical protein
MKEASNNALNGGGICAAACQSSHLTLVAEHYCHGELFNLSLGQFKKCACLARGSPGPSFRHRINTFSFSTPRKVLRQCNLNSDRHAKLFI